MQDKAGTSTDFKARADHAASHVGDCVQNHNERNV